LLFNAAKHSSVSSATVKVQQIDPASVRITVADQGTGFDPLAIDTGGCQRLGPRPFKHARKDRSDRRQARHFLHEDNTVQVKKNIREMIVFAKQDLTRDPPFSHLDPISCRNLLIYFNTELQKRIVPMFHYVLNPDGILFLGKSESIGQFADLFDPIVKKWKIYKRRDVMKPPVISIGPPRQHQPGARAMAGESRREREAAAKHIMADSILSSFGHSAVLIDDRLEIVYVHGEVEPYLKLAQGQAGLNILNMVRPPLRLDLRSMIHKATRESSLVRSNPIKFEHNDKPRQVVLQAGPAAVLPGAPALTLVIFEESAAAADDAETPLDRKKSEDPRLMELEQELAATREHLQTTVEELETANEELQSLNEELQSANEELQSSNEELETTNEELTTVNEELQVKTNELAAANTDLENILKRTGIAMVIVNRKLKVTRFTPGVTAIFQMTAADRGQVLTTIPTKLTLPDLRSVLAEVIEKVQPYEFAFNLDTHNCQMRVLPYLGETGQAAGAMLIFLDRTELMKTEFALENSTACQRAILNGVQDGIVIVSEDGVIETFNPAAERIW
jgi:two-component system CheB/CheR fusion protein